MLLAIDTATNVAGIALADAQGTRGLFQWRTERNHTVELLPNIVALLSRSGVTSRELKAIAVASGPGSYTGLRIGLSVAKGFCYAQGAALIGVPTLDISAYAYEPATAALCAVLQAGRGRLAVRFYRPARAGTGRVWQAAGASWLGRADELAALCADDDGHRRVFFAGEIDDISEKVLRERLGPRAAFAPSTERTRDPRVLARLAWERWQCGQIESIEAFAPDYGQ